MPAEFAYTDLQVRQLETTATAESEDIALGAVTVENSGDADGVETVVVTLAAAGADPVEVQSTRESLEVGHSHRVRFTLDGAALERAGALGAGEHTVAVGPAGGDPRLTATITLD